jgi:hypothetical protein
MLTALSPGEWLGLVVAFVLFLGPGLAVLSWYPGVARLGKSMIVPVAFCLSLSAWAVLMGWLQPLQLALNPLTTALVLGLGWIISFLRWRHYGIGWRWEWRWPRQVHGSRLGLWAVVVGTAATSVFALRHVVAGLGSDSYHHSLIVQLIAQRGILPSDYLPYAPLVTFRYHYGFHAFVAALVILTGLKAPVLTPLMGQVLMALAAWSVAFFTESTTRSRAAAALSAGLVGLVIVFPAYYVNWGRDTQLAGLTILPVFLGLTWDWVDRRPALKETLILGLLAAGLALTHYRLVFMATLGVIILLGWRVISRRRDGTALVGLLRSLLATSGVAVVACAPWLWHAWSTRQQGFGMVLGPTTSEAFSLNRLGPDAINYPTNMVVLSLLIAALAVGWWWRDPLVRPLTVWAVAMLAASGPRVLGSNLDTVTVFISLYFPAATVVGWMAVRAVDRIGHRWRLIRPAIWVGAAVLFIWGAASIAIIADPTAQYVGPKDLRASQWIMANTPSSARFMVNTFHFGYWPSFVIGSDAGGWLPLLASRSAVTPPMTYAIERASSPGFAQDLVALDQLGGHLTSPQALLLLLQAGIDYVYIGERGGQIDVTELRMSSSFQEVYQDGPVHIFRFLGSLSKSG